MYPLLVLPATGFDENGDIDLARVEPRTMTTAFLLNRNNPRIVDLLGAILASNQYRAVMDGYLTSIVFWELLAPRALAVIPILPVEERERLAAYIEKYVYVAAESLARGG